MFLQQPFLWEFNYFLLFLLMFGIFTMVATASFYEKRFRESIIFGIAAGASAIVAIACVLKIIFACLPLIPVM